MSPPGSRPSASALHRLWHLVALVLVAYAAACVEGGAGPDESGQGRDPQNEAPPAPGEPGYPAARSFRLALRDEGATQLHLWGIEDGQLAGKGQVEALPNSLLAIGDLTGDRHDDIAFYGNTGKVKPWTGNVKALAAVRPVVGTSILDPLPTIRCDFSFVTRLLGFSGAVVTGYERAQPNFKPAPWLVWFGPAYWSSPGNAIYRGQVVNGAISNFGEIMHVEDGVEPVALLRAGPGKPPGLVMQAGREVRTVELADNAPYSFAVAKSTALARPLAPLPPEGGAGARVVGAALVNGDDLDDLLVYDPATRSVEAWLLDGAGGVVVQPLLADLPANLEPAGVLRGPERDELVVDRPIELRAGVRVLDADPGFASAEHDGTQVTVRYGQASAPAEPGTMVVGSAADHGFFGRVAQRFTAAEMPSLGPHDVAYVLEPTDLSELIQNGAFRYVGVPAAPEPEGAVRTVAQGGPKPPVPSWLDSMGVKCKGEGGLKLEVVEKSLPPLVSPVLELDMAGGQIRGGKVGLQIGGQAKLKVEASAAAAATCVLEPDPKLARALRFSHPLPVPIPGLAQAIRVTHTLTPAARFEAAVSAQLVKASASVVATLEFQTGYEYKNSQWDSYSNFVAKAEPKFELPLAEQLALTLSFKVTPYVNWTMGVWNVGDRHLPQTTLQYELGAQLSASATGCWEGKVEHKLDLGVAWRLPYFNPQIAACDPNAAHVPATPPWNGAASPQLPDCRCSQWVHKEFDLFWAAEYPAWLAGGGQEADAARHRNAALDWFLNGRCVDAEISLGRFPEFSQVGVPYLDVKTPDAKGGDWTALVNRAWLQGNINRGGRMYLATSPRQPRAYFKSPPEQPDVFTTERTITADEFDQLRRNGYALEELSNSDACYAVVVQDGQQPPPLSADRLKCGVASRSVFFDKALGAVQFRKTLFEATIARKSGSFVGAKVCAGCALSAPDRKSVV